jgi:vacuolar iron transporter family protein
MRIRPFKNARHSVEVGLSFGLTSGVITTLGLMVGVYAGTHSSLAVISSILTIALADALSDAMGIHISEESENVHTSREVWISTITTFLAKLLVSASFIIAFLVTELETAVFINIGWGLFLLIAYNIYIGLKQDTPTWKVVLEHLFIAVLVVVLTYFLGEWIAVQFGG